MVWAPRLVGKDPDGKTRAICKLMAERRWSCALLTDLRFPQDGCHELTVGGATWLLVHEGRVGVAMNPFLAARWRAGGSTMIRVKGWEGKARAGLSISADGWRPGLLLVPVYAPLVSKTLLEKREAFREQLSTILHFFSSRRRLVVGGISMVRWVRPRIEIGDTFWVLTGTLGAPRGVRVRNCCSSVNRSRS